MKYGYRFICLIIIILVLVSVIGCKTHPEYTDEDAREIIETATLYYSNLETKDYVKALAYLYPIENAVQTFEFQNRSEFLNEAATYMDYQITLIELSAEPQENRAVEYGSAKKPDKTLYTLSSTINVADVTRGSKEYKETLFFKKDTNKWYIYRISSPDKYVIIRSNRYYYNMVYGPESTKAK